MSNLNISNNNRYLFKCVKVIPIKVAQFCIHNIAKLVICVIVFFDFGMKSKLQGMIYLSGYQEFEPTD